MIEEKQNVVLGSEKLTDRTRTRKLCLIVTTTAEFAFPFCAWSSFFRACGPIPNCVSMFGFSRQSTDNDDREQRGDRRELYKPKCLVKVPNHHSQNISSHVSCCFVRSVRLVSCWEDLMSFNVSFVNRTSKRDSFSCSHADAISCEGSRSLFGSPHTSHVIVCSHLSAIESN